MLIVRRLRIIPGSPFVFKGEALSLTAGGNPGVDGQIQIILDKD